MKNALLKLKRTPMCLFIYSIQYSKTFNHVFEPNVNIQYPKVISYITENQVLYH